MMITPATITALNTAYTNAFQGALALAETQYQKVAMIVPSATASNTYGWLGMFPKMREWVGDRVIKDMSAQSMILLNRKFEATVGVARTDIEDDNLGLYTPLIQQMAQSAAELADELVFEVFKKGETGICYDGQSFFDAEHPVYANVDGTGTVKMVSNISTGTDTPWYIVDVKNAVKPFIYQNRLNPEFEVKSDPKTSEASFIKDLYLYGVRARGEAGYGMWQFAHKAKIALDRKNVAELIAQISSMKGDGDKLLGLRPSMLVVPPMLEDRAREILNADVINGTTNSMKGRLELLVSPWLA